MRVRAGSIPCCAAVVGKAGRAVRIAPARRGWAGTAPGRGGRPAGTGRRPASRAARAAPGSATGAGASARGPLPATPGRPQRGGGAFGGVVDRDDLEQLAGDAFAAVLDGQDRRAAAQLGRAADHAAAAPVEML